MWGEVEEMRRFEDVTFLPLKPLGFSHLHEDGEEKNGIRLQLGESRVEFWSG